ncbi:MAG: tetratricopeptide repeat protein [Lactobacillus sp.]|jgi:Flp pilus assembly protein TadD|nr:tetratricopeptide repeat protein [Lactobacillus sp.]
MNQQAAALFDKDDQQGAISLLVKAIAKDSDDLENYLQLGTYLTAVQDFEQAEELFQKALHKFPNNQALNYNLGVLYYEAGELKKAQAQFQSLNTKAQTAENYLMLARVFFKQQNYQKATAFALTAHDLAPKDTGALVLLGDSLLSLGNLKQAQDFYLDAYGLDKANLAALFGAGMVQYVLDHDDHLLQAVKAQDPKYYHAQQKRLSDIEKYVATQTNPKAKSESDHDA